MSTKARLADLLETMLERFDNLEQHLAKLETKMDQCVTVSIEARAEVDTLRARMLDEADRAGATVRRIVNRLEQLEHSAAE